MAVPAASDAAQKALTNEFLDDIWQLQGLFSCAMASALAVVGLIRRDFLAVRIGLSDG